ncbi:MAG: suppressor of fused domain protein, partial [Chloroflexota bacterium]
LDDPMFMTLNQQIVMAHYNQYWGMATEVLRFAFSDAPHDAPFVAEFAIGTDDEPLTVYATIGMSDLPMPEAGPIERVELFMYANECRDELREALALLAIYPFQNHSPLAPLDTIYGSRGLVGDSRLTSVLLTFPLREPEEFAAVDVGEYTVHLLNVTPITEDERQLCVAHGSLTLLTRFAREGVDVANLRRASVEGREPP